MLELVEPITVAFAEQDEGPLRKLAETADDPWTRALALQTRAVRAENDGDLAAQRDLLRATHTAFAALGERFGLGMVLYSLGELENLAGEHDAAAAAFDEAIALTAELGNDEDLHQFIAGRAMVDARRGELRAPPAPCSPARSSHGARTAASPRRRRRSSAWRAISARPAPTSRVVDAAIAADPATFGIPNARPTSPCCARRWSSRRATRRRPGCCCRPAAELAVDQPRRARARHGGRGGRPARARGGRRRRRRRAARRRRRAAGHARPRRPEVVALLAALGPHAEDRIAAAAPRAGAATLTAFLPA